MFLWRPISSLWEQVLQEVPSLRSSPRMVLRFPVSLVLPAELSYRFDCFDDIQRSRNIRYTQSSHGQSINNWYVDCASVTARCIAESKKNVCVILALRMLPTKSEFMERASHI